MSEPKIVRADLDRLEHQHATLTLLDEYCSDPMGDGKPIEEDARERLIPGLKAHPGTLVILGFLDEEPVGLAVCFRGFSTFAARPLLNLSDFYVRPSARGRGIGRRLLTAMERAAIEQGCCRLTLEVQEHNARARAVYAAAGFAMTVHVPEAGAALFLTKLHPSPSE